MTVTNEEHDVFWYEPQHLTSEQQAKLRHLRDELEAAAALLPAETGLADDMTLLRFLKARQWSVHRAVKMYQAMSAWRQEQHIDQLPYEQFPELPLVRQHYPQFFHKTDRWGRPVWIELLGHIDVDAMLKVCSIERFMRYHIQCCESFRQVKLPACSAAAGRPIMTQTIVLDMSGLSPMRHFTLTVQKFLHTLSHVDSNNFPEHLGCLFMINTPLLFRSFWSVIKGFLDERTLAKIKVLGSNYKAELLAVIPPENLPVQFGGQSPCTEMVDVGPWQDPAIIAQCPALRKAAAARLLKPGCTLVASSSSNSLEGRGGSFIGAGSADGGSSSVSSGDEGRCSGDGIMMCADAEVVCA